MSCSSPRRQWALRPASTWTDTVGDESVYRRSQHAAATERYIVVSDCMNHLAFHVASREQVDSITEGVRTCEGSTVLYDDQHPFASGYYALYCEDPVGIKVEIVSLEA